MKAEYSPGLRGVVAGETAICRVDPQGGLHYRGYDVQELAIHANYEEVVWLLLHGELPSMSQLASSSRQMAEERYLPHSVLEFLRLRPSTMHPMDSLRTGVSLLAGFDPDLADGSPEANLRKAMRLITKAACLVTSGWRISHSQELLPPESTLTHAGNFLYQLAGVMPDLWCMEVLDTVFVLYAEHGFNASTFSARVTASTQADVYAAVTTALGTLKGSLHGGANERVMRMLREIGAADRAEAWVKEQLAERQKIMGFGHPVYERGDARVPLMREMARKLGERFGQPQWFEICGALEEILRREKDLHANVDLYAAPVLFLLGIPPELNTTVFACARMAGWCAHVLEQQEQNCLIRPISRYIGPAARRYLVGQRKKAA